MKRSDYQVPPILRAKHYGEASQFAPHALLREARRQKQLPNAPVPDICILDPDGDIVSHLLSEHRAQRFAPWACYHTELFAFEHAGLRFGIIGRAVGAAFAVLVAEELFASGCKLLISMTSAGQILPLRSPPYFVIIDRALRDEGTSYHYLPPADFSSADRELVRLARHALGDLGRAVEIGPTWTTDAPFRETASAIARARAGGILAVEMEAAALYAFAMALKQRVLCLAHVTNQMGRIEGDFEKGAADGAEQSLSVIGLIARRYSEDTKG